MAIHKKGSTSSLKKYRGITLLSCLGNLFTSLLNERLMNCALDNNILAKKQIGFLKGKRTMVQQRFQGGKKLFACFTDFEKAFDRVPRGLLIKKFNGVA